MLVFMYLVDVMGCVLSVLDCWLECLGYWCEDVIGCLMDDFMMLEFS